MKKNAQVINQGTIPFDSSSDGEGFFNNFCRVIDSNVKLVEVVSPDTELVWGAVNQYLKKVQINGEPVYKNVFMWDCVNGIVPIKGEVPKRKAPISSDETRNGNGSSCGCGGGGENAQSSILERVQAKLSPSKLNLSGLFDELNLNECPYNNSVIIVENYNKHIENNFNVVQAIINYYYNSMNSLPITSSETKPLVILHAAYLKDIPQEISGKVVRIGEAEVTSNYIEWMGNLVGELLGTPITLNDSQLSVLKGFSLAESTYLIKLYYSQHSAYDKESFEKTVVTYKTEKIRNIPGLEYFHNPGSFDDIGGLDNIKEWIQLRKNSYKKEAAELGIIPPKGILLTGIPGSGKSLTAKCISSSLGFPLIKLDCGAIYGRFVGQSEENLRGILKYIDTLGDCVLWIDEVEKGISGTGSSGATDGGTTSRVFGHLLSWMQDHIGHVFIIATSNDIKGLPPEFLRKGRFDEIFFLDLPCREDRAKIFNIHLNKKNKMMDKNININLLAESSAGCTGAEIESIVNNSVIKAFSSGKKVDTDLLLVETKNTSTVSNIMKSKIEELREWARTSGAIAANKQSLESDKSVASSLGQISYFNHLNENHNLN